MCIARLQGRATAMPRLPFHWILPIGVPASAATFDWSAQGWAIGVCALVLLLGCARRNGCDHLPDPGSSGAGLARQRPGNGDPPLTHARGYVSAGGRTERPVPAQSSRPGTRRSRPELARVA